MSVHDGLGPDLDLGRDHVLWFTEWEPDLALNPQYVGLPLQVPGGHYGAVLRHLKGPVPIPAYPGEPHCVSGLVFDTPHNRYSTSLAYWTVVSWEPLTIVPSVLCGCGDHGYVTQGAWVPV
jgi:hypothetical protein